MSHHLDYITDQALSTLVIADTSKSDLNVREGRITKLGGFTGDKGIRIKTRRIHCGKPTGASTTLDIRGEDLYALREFLAELPEEAFVRPADPVEVPDRWTDGDVITWIPRISSSDPRAYLRFRGKWVCGSSVVDDSIMEAGLREWPENYRVGRQASGQDL